MPSTSNSTGAEQAIVDALVERLQAVAETKLGYGATGLEDSLTTPAILVQLERLVESGRQGAKIKAQLQFTISAAVKTSDQTTSELLALTKQIRQTLKPNERLCPEARTHSLNDTRFDIAPSRGQLSFADSTLTVETIL